MNNKQSNKANNQHNQKAGKHHFPAFFKFLSVPWSNIRRGRSPGAVLLFTGTIIAFFMSIPIIYVVWRSLFAGADRWLSLLDGRIPSLIWNTMSLTFMVTLFSLIIGVSLAWIINRTDVPGRRAFQWLLALPLVIPPYVGAVTYIVILGPRGWIRNFWVESELLSQFDYSINVYSFWGVFFVLTMFTFPYVYLIASASLRRMNRNFEEVARSQGLTTFQIFWKVNLPFLRPAIGAGGILVALYVLSDFGAIAMLRYMTFTAAIYYRMESWDNISASILSFVLIALTMVILWINSVTQKKQKVYQTSNTFKPPETLSLGKWKPAAMIYVSFIFFLSVLLPLLVLIYWSAIGWAEGALNSRFWGYAWNSVKVSGIAAILSMICALPIIYLKSRYPSLLSNIIEKLSFAGYALPGVIVALGIIFIFNQYIPWLYNTYYLVAIAFVIRFIPQAMQSGEASLSLISPRIDEAARSLGQPPWKVLVKVIIPLIMPGVLAGGALVFVSSIKELPATLLLRPPGFDTLAVRIWVEAGEAVYHLAAPAALLVILISIIPLRWMLKRY